MVGHRGLVKLFGQTFPLTPVEMGDAPAAFAVGDGGGATVTGGAGKDEGWKGRQDHVIAPVSGGNANAEIQNKKQDQKPSQKELEVTKPEKPKEEDEEGGEEDKSSGTQEKTIKKPDKILPCPRCNSMDTKFCYYNNYNVNQPRHFCRSCQRYWTAGGTMRNVPVGAGRRKSKHSSNHHRQITVSEAALQIVRPDITGQAHTHSVLTHKGTLLSFGSGNPLCETANPLLDLTEKATRNSDRKIIHHPENPVAPPTHGGATAETGEEHSSGSSATASNLTEDGSGTILQESLTRKSHGCFPRVPCVSRSSWPAPWNVPPPFYISSLPVSFYPTPPFWGCVPGAWNVPFLAPVTSSPLENGPSGSCPDTPTLGKHSREGDVFEQSNSKKVDISEQKNGENCLWFPKTLRIDDPEEAAKSSIWETVGIKNDKADGRSRGELFGCFNQPKASTMAYSAEPSKALHANPAALSRSLNFLETS